MAMKKFRSPPGRAITMATQTIYTNPAGSGVREIVQFTFNSTDSANDCALPICEWLDADNGDLALQILPTNVKVAKLEGSVKVTHVFDPGDSLRVASSANGDIVGIVRVIGREAV